MAKQKEETKKQKIIKELSKLGINFDARESIERLEEELRIAKRDRQRPAPQTAPPQDTDEELLPLTEEEQMELKGLERMAKKGRKIEQPTPAEMKRLGKLRARAKITS